MAGTLADANFLLYTNDYSETPQGSKLMGSTAIKIQSGGAQTPTIVSVQGFLESLIDLVSSSPGTGFLCTNSGGTPFFRSFGNGTGIQVTNPSGLSGNIFINQIPLTVPQLFRISDTPGTMGPNATSLAIIAGSGISRTITEGSNGQYILEILGDSTSGTVTSISASSTTGLIANVTSPTTTPNVIFNLPGPGGGAITQGCLLAGNSSGAYQGLALGTDAHVLTSQGGNAIWAAPAASVVNISSSTGIVVDSTGTDTFTINFPNPISEGDLLVGNSSGEYQGLALGAATHILTSQGGTAVWAAPAPSVVNISSSTGIVVGNTGTDTFTINFPNPIHQGDLLVGNSSGEFATFALGAPNKFLISDGTTTTWGPSNDPSAGQVVGYDGTDIKWIPNTVATLPSGIAFFEDIFDLEEFTYNGFVYYFVADDNVTVKTVIQSTGVLVGLQQPCSYPFVLLDPNGTQEPEKTKGYYIVSGVSGDGQIGTTAAYTVITYDYDPE